MLLFYRPGLLGKNKYEFAKTYCDVKVVKGYHGRFIQVIYMLLGKYFTFLKKVYEIIYLFQSVLYIWDKSWD